ncbi:hypothetical protein BH10PSE12_BH10PSE12_02580 [soil metagenome]
MADTAIGEHVESIFKAFAGWVVPITLGILMLIPKWRKANMEDAAIAVAAWKDLAERLGAENKDLHDTLTSVRDRVRHLEDDLDKERRDRREVEDRYREEIKRLSDEMDGVKRMIVQGSRSVAVALTGKDQV